MYAILWQGRAHDLYIVFDVGSGAAKPEADYLHHLRRYVTGRIVYAFLYPLSLWSIKFSFLLFFRRLGRKARCYTFLWWGVLGCNIICLGVWYAVPVWRYTISSIQYISSVLRDSLVKTCGVKLRFHSVLQGSSYRESQSSRLEDENSGRCHLRRFKQVHLVLDRVFLFFQLTMTSHNNPNLSSMEPPSLHLEKARSDRLVLNDGLRHDRFHHPRCDCEFHCYRRVVVFCLGGSRNVHR